jgi:outer membrane receptor protein involved in Fe transport
VGATYSIELGHKWAERIEFGVRANGVGSIVWDEAGEYVQPFYTLLDASVRLHTEYGSVALWGHNLTNTRYNTFCFASMGNRFLQRGKPTTLGITLNITIDNK